MGITCSWRKVTILVGFVCLDTCWDDDLNSLSGNGVVFICCTADGGNVLSGGEPALWCFCCTGLTSCDCDLVGFSLGGRWRCSDSGSQQVKNEGSNIGMHLDCVVE